MSNCFSPQTLADYRGQDKVKNKLKIHVKAAQKRNEPLGHFLVYGGSGLGKTTIANIVGNEMGGNVKVVLCPTVKKVSEMVDILRSVSAGDILFLDEIHALSKKCMEVLYPVMEDGILNAECDGERIEEYLPRFTVAGATTDAGDLLEPLRNRFVITLELVPYKPSHIEEMIYSSCENLGVDIDEDACRALARCSRGVPRRARNLTLCTRDYACVINEEGDGAINLESAIASLDEAGIDAETGLTQQDVRYLEVLVKKYGGKSVGIDNIAAAMGDNKKTLEEMVEPYLLHENYIVRTPRGRKATQKACSFIYSLDN